MNKIRNHTIGASLTAVALAATMLTACGTNTDECDDAESMSYTQSFDMLPGKVGGGSGGRGGSSGSGGKGSGSKPSMNKGPGKSGNKATSGGSSSGGSSGGGSHKTKLDTDDCEDDD